MDKIKWILFGGIYSEHYEEYSDGGPLCLQDIEMSFRVTIAIISTILNIIIVYSTYNTVMKSKEMHFQQGRSPSKFERLIGLICLLTFLIQTCYKLYTGRGMFMNNPCHIVILMQGFVLLTKKSKLSTFVFICSLRWLYGVFLALRYPVLCGLNLPFEVELYWIEHILGALIGPLTLTLSGRFILFDSNSFIAHQLIGWSSHIFYQRLYMLPLSILTWANLNYTLCRPDTDPFIPYIGNWYYILSEFYLNIISISAVSVIYLLTYLFRKGLKQKLD